AGNDRIAGAASFEQKASAVTAARSLGFHVTMNVVLHRHNLGHVEAIVARALEWGVPRLELAHVQYAGWAFRNRAGLLPEPGVVRRAAAEVERLRAELDGRLEILHVLPDWYQDRPKACLSGWGRVHLTVAPDGTALPCAAARGMPGLEPPNVREHSLDEIWFDSAAFRRFRGTEWMPEPCRGCPRREIDFGGCRCQAWLVAGDPALADPVCGLAPHHERLLALRRAAQGPAPFTYRRFGVAGDDRPVAPAALLVADRPSPRLEMPDRPR